MALEQAEPDFNLIKPGSIRGQPQNVEVQAQIAHAVLLLKPAFELLGSVGGAVIKDENDGVHLSMKSLRKNDLLDKTLEIEKPLALAAGSIDLAIGDGKSGEQMTCTATMVAHFVESRFVWTSRTRRLLPLARLDGGFFIQAHEPDAALQERLRLKIGVENGAGALQEGLWVMDMLPGMVAPGAKAFGFEPATYRTRGEMWQARIVRNLSRQGASTPTGERDRLLTGQATGNRRDLRADLRGKNASVLHCAARRKANGF